MEPRSSQNVLIVDDEESIRDVIIMNMDGIDANFLQADSGLEALKVIAKFEVAVIVCDITMPEMTGIQLLAHLRAEGNTTPFIVHTGFGSTNHNLQALRLGAFDFVEKPFKPELMRSLILEALKLSKAIKILNSQMNSSLEDAGFSVTPQLRQAVASVLALKAIRVKESA